MKSFKLAAIGGTFDRLHRGHEFFIKKAFERAERVLVGITSEEYVRKKFSIFLPRRQAGNFQFSIKVRSYRDRRRELEEFLKREKLWERASVVKIHDEYGEADKNPNLEVIFVTSDSREGAENINKKRREGGLRKLEIIKVPLVRADDRGNISSTRIRRGEIDREGRLYRQYKIYGKILPENIRSRLQKPLGLHLTGSENIRHDIPAALKEVIADVSPPMVITIGDEVTTMCNGEGIRMDIAVVDFKVKREKKYKKLADHLFADKHERVVLKGENKAGMIEHKMMSDVDEAIEGVLKDGKQRVMVVRGEEDLVAIPAVLLAPLESVVVYGQPNRGVGVMVASEEKKKQIIEILV